MRMEELNTTPAKLMNFIWILIFKTGGPFCVNTHMVIRFQVIPIYVVEVPSFLTQRHIAESRADGSKRRAVFKSATWNL